MIIQYFSSEKFNNDLSEINGDNHNTNENYFNNMFSSFYKKYNKIVNEHAPIKKDVKSQSKTVF